MTISSPPSVVAGSSGKRTKSIRPWILLSHLLLALGCLADTASATANAPGQDQIQASTTMTTARLLTLRGGTGAGASPIQPAASMIPSAIVRSGIQSAFIMTVADLSIQVLAEKKKFPSLKMTKRQLNPKRLRGWRRQARLRPSDISSNNRKQVDVIRTLRWAVLGLTLHGPYFCSAFNKIDSWYGPSTSFDVVVKKTLTAQLVFFPPYLLAMFSYMGYMEGLPRRQITNNVKTKAPQAFQSGCVFWPVANTINFGLVPSNARVLYTATAAGIWNGYLSYMNAKS